MKSNGVYLSEILKETNSAHNDINMKDYIKELVRRNHGCQIHTVDIDSTNDDFYCTGNTGSRKLYDILEQASVIYTANYDRMGETIDDAKPHECESITELINYYRGIKIDVDFHIIGVKIIDELYVHRPYCIDNVEIDELDTLSKERDTIVELEKLWLDHK